jgi:hypothetical protein
MDTMKQHYLHVLILLIVCATLFGFNIGAQDFWGGHSEERRAEVGREMVVSGDWIVPHLNGEPFVTKPPLHYWVVVLSFMLTGKFDEVSAQLLVILAAEYWNDYDAMKRTCLKQWTWKAMDIPIVGFAGVLCLAGACMPIAAQLYLPKYLTVGIIWGIIFLCLGIALILVFLRGNVLGTSGIYTTATLLAYLFAFSTIIPEMNIYRSRKIFFDDVAQIVGDRPVVDYGYGGYIAHFYLQRVLPEIRSIQELEALFDRGEPVFVIIPDKNYHALQNEYPELMKRFTIVLDRMWVSTVNPKQRRGLLLLRT